MLAFLGNIIWFIFGGALMAFIWFILGFLLSITILGIPFGMQCFKFARLTLFPFGKRLETHFDKHPIMNLIWALLFGWELMIAHLILFILCSITVVGIPFGKQWFKMAMLALIPFGATIR